VRQWFRREERDENIDRGRELLDRERKRLGFAELPSDLHSLLGYDSMESVYEAIGYGGLSVQGVTQKLVEHTAPAITTEPRPHLTPSKVPKGMPPVRVLGEGGVHVTLARCCKPIPGDSIIGFVTRSRGVTVHRRECHNIRSGAERERIIECDWAPSGDVYAAAVQVDAWDRVGLLRDISTLVAAEDVNMVGVRTQEHDDRRTTVHLTLETQSRLQLARLMSRLEGLRGVIGVSRTEG
jgi:GTP pyrophosphokinase